MTPPPSRLRHTLRGVLAFSACAVLAASALTACGSDDEGAGGGNVELTLQVWGDTKYAEDQFKVYQEQYPDQSKGQTMKVLSAGKTDTDSINKFRLELSSGKDIPDILQLNYSWVPEFAEAGVLSDVKTLADPFLPNVSQAAQRLMQYDGKYVAFPYEVKSKLWYYRKDLFQQAGIDITQVKTQADFVAAGQKLKAKFPKSNVWNLGTNPATYDWQMIAAGNGAKYATKSPCAFVVGTDPGTAQAFKAIKDLRNSGVVETKIDDWTPEWQTALADGTIASTLNASWFPAFLTQYAPDLKGKWGVTTWPEIGGAVGGSESAGSVFVIPAKSKHKKEAAEFLGRTLMDAKGTKAFAKIGGYVPNVIALQDDPELTNHPYFGTELSTAFKAADKDYKVFAFDPAANKEQVALSNAMTKYLTSNDAEPTTYLKAAQDELTAQVGCPFKS
ncbi:ABC transporter substrate-binding protein [Dactylosporangium siamense]|uniref:ABC transporter substrate-binding protein n=1 Tax=Dactylosporangium siamense TaxID=685454 RepID=A0A919UAT7_9ACTN|nr:extracellular solute-binding protein [Dactylosporangium siamense]GIG45025.1 ABC transporter substrate-binding protein [Dactylosporangium siamense]